MKYHNNKGVALIELLAVLLVSSVIMLSVSRLLIFLVRTQQHTYNTNRLNNEGAIISNILIHEIDDVKPDSINKLSDTSYEFIGSQETLTLTTQDNGDGTYEILLDGEIIAHQTRMVFADINPVVCDTCPYTPGDENSYKFYKIEFTLEVDTALTDSGVRQKEFITSLTVFRGF